MHRILPFIIPLFLIVLGLGIYFYLTSEPLSEKQFTHKGEQFSILVPRTFQYKDTGGAAIWGRSEEILTVALVSVEKKSTKIITCNDLKAQGTEVAFIAKIKSLQKDVEVCKTPDLSFPGYIIFDTPSLEENNTRYLIAIHAKEDFVKTKDGQEKVKRIIESFKIGP